MQLKLGSVHFINVKVNENKLCMPITYISKKKQNLGETIMNIEQAKN